MDFRKRQKDYLSKLKSVQDRGPGGDVLGEVFETNDDDYDPARLPAAPATGAEFRFHAPLSRVAGGG